MSNTYRILHFGDIHYKSSNDWDSSNVLNEFKQILPSIRQSLGQFDFAFCTGDISFSGESEQFDYMNEWFTKTFYDESGLGILRENMFIVPGNHDVTRSSINSAVCLIQNSIKTENSQQEIANHYNDRSILELITKRLESYRNFINTVSTHGCNLDGSWASNFGTGRYQVELEGLSSSWLSGPDNDDGRLVIGRPQIHKISKHRTNGPFRIALVHHPISSLLECDREEVEIELQNKYDIILRGHLHSSSTRIIDQNSKKYIEIATGALYSGSKYPNSFNVLEINFENRVLRIRPFIWLNGKWISDRNTYSPHEYLDVDLAFSLGEELKEELSSASNIPQIEQSEDEEKLVFPNDTNNPLLYIDEKKEDDGKFSETVDESIIVPHTISPNSLVSDLSAWHDLCDSLANSIRAHQPCCVFVPPGFESTVVLPSLIEFCDEHIRDHVFHVRGDNLSTMDELCKAIEASLGVSITDFVRYCDTNGGGLLVIDGFTSSHNIRDSSINSHDSIQRLVIMIRDYCPELAIVAFTRDPATPSTNQIEPLDAAEVGDFVRNHHWCDFEFTDVAQIEAVTDATGGIPQQVEHFLELRRVSDFETAISELRRPGKDFKIGELTERQQNILNTPKDENTGIRNLIDILAVLERGEPLREIRKMMMIGKPSAQDVLLLTSMQLATAIKIDSPESSKIDPVSVVRLRRHAWDFVNKKMSDDRRSEIVSVVAKKYFGENWATDAVKLRSTGRRRNSRRQDVSRVFANEVYIIEQIFNAAGENKTALLNVAALALKYCEKLRRQDRFGDAYFASRELLSKVEHACSITGDTAVEDEFLLSTARSSRMAGETKLAIDLLGGMEESFNTGEFKSRRLDALAALMFCYESEGRSDDTKRIATKLIKESPKSSWHNIQAAAIHASLIGDNDEARNNLLSLERKARRYKHNIVVENILLDLAYRAVSPVEAKKYLQKVRSGDERMYNYIRATAKYASLTIKHDGAESLSVRDIAAIEAGYTFMFSQRMVSLLTTFHEIIWDIFESRNEKDRQIELLKHSSFVWRLCGDEKTEQEYLRKVKNRDSLELEQNDGALRKAFSYIMARLRKIDRP